MLKAYKILDKTCAYSYAADKHGALQRDTT